MKNTLFISNLDVYFDFYYSKFIKYIKENIYLILILCGVALAVYGFELFNFNITMDEELSALRADANLSWVVQGRWGMYMLNKFLLPRNVIPFVPLGLALFFHIGAILIILESWKVKFSLERVAIGAIALTYPSVAYVYVFSTLNYGVGIGYFCIALSLFLYTSNTGTKQFLAVVPATFAISIYQGFIPALILVYLAYLIVTGLRDGGGVFKRIAVIALIHMLSFLLYFIGQILFLIHYNVSSSSYYSHKFALERLFQHFPEVFSRFINVISNVYLGDSLALKILFVVALLGFAANLVRSRADTIVKPLMVLFVLAFLVLPFAHGFIMNGNYIMRYFIGLPVTFSGLIMVGMGDNPRFFKAILTLIAMFCVFQFSVSANRLFGSSHLALQADRLLSNSLIERIYEAKSEAGARKIEYMEMVGLLNRGETELMPRSSTFGRSFFSQDSSDTNKRMLAFMRTIGYTELSLMPNEQRYKLVSVANSMPIWPESGSVKVIGNTVLVKFSPYTKNQKILICEFMSKKYAVQLQNFCK